jgi:hypothetical protein
LKGNKLSYSQKFESHKKDPYLFFYVFSKYTDLGKMQTRFPKKNASQARSNGPGQHSAGPARICDDARGRARFKLPTGEARRSAAGEGQRGMGRPRPSDQVRIDGLWSSSSPGHGKQRGNPRADLGGGVAHRGAFSGHGEAMSGRGASRQAWRGATEVGLLSGRGSVCQGQRTCFGARRGLCSRAPRSRIRVGLGSCG